MQVPKGVRLHCGICNATLFKPEKDQDFSWGQFQEDPANTLCFYTCLLFVYVQRVFAEAI